MARKDLKIGDLVEDCSLMPGVLMEIKGDDLSVRRLDFDNYEGQEFSQCSASHCGVVKITAKQAADRLKLGKDALGEIWKSLDNCKDSDIGNEWNRRVEVAADLIRNIEIPPDGAEEIAESVLLKAYGRPNQPFTDVQRKNNKHILKALVQMFQIAKQSLYDISKL
jgi:succinate dehydrogenase/fumarate reductase flavoprotein subunit